MKRLLSIPLWCIPLAVVSSSGCIHSHIETRALHTFDRVQLSDVFYAEGAAIGDLNGDGHPDVVAGPYWYEGPEFDVRREIYAPTPFDPLEYSDNFIVHVFDFDDNGWQDILIVGFPGREAYWYANPGRREVHWERHLIFDGVDNESPFVGDVTGNGIPELAFHHEGYVGYAVFNADRPTEPWAFRRISKEGEWGPFTHGLGVGDLTGNGHPDIIMSTGWWENPGSSDDLPVDTLWRHHPADFAERGAQIYAYDVDGDGLNDVITSLDAHGWGLAWFEQVRTDDEIRFERRLIMGEDVDDNPFGVRFSQPHAVVLADVDRDGLMDVVTGKRFWAHGPDGDPEPNAPAVVYWFQLQRGADGAVSFIPHMVDDDSGVGVFFVADDLTGDGYRDLAIANKKGTFVFRHRVRNVPVAEWEEAQPKMIGRPASDSN